MITITQKELEASGESLYSSLASFVNRGELIVYPTETIYGVGGIDTPKVCEKVISAKMRAPENPFIRVAGNWSLFEPYDFEINSLSQKLMDNFWPGNLTLILYSKREKCKIGIRVSEHPFIQKITPFLNAPLISSSANLSDCEYLPDFDIIRESFSGVVKKVVKWKQSPLAQPSTVVEVGEEGYKIFREAVIKKEDIEKVL